MSAHRQPCRRAMQVVRIRKPGLIQVPPGPLKFVPPESQASPADWPPHPGSDVKAPCAGASRPFNTNGSIASLFRPSWAQTSHWQQQGVSTRFLLPYVPHVTLNCRRKAYALPRGAILVHHIHCFEGNTLVGWLQERGTPLALGSIKGFSRRLNM